MNTAQATQANILSCYLNGTLSHSGAKAALRAIGYSRPGAELILKEAWVGYAATGKPRLTGIKIRVGGIE